MPRGSDLLTLLNLYGAHVDLPSITLIISSETVISFTSPTYPAKSPATDVLFHYPCYSPILWIAPTDYSPSSTKLVLQCVLLRLEGLDWCCQNLTNESNLGSRYVPFPLSNHMSTIPWHSCHVHYVKGLTEMEAPPFVYFLLLC
jgi:hypothetical protein